MAENLSQHGVRLAHVGHREPFSATSMSARRQLPENATALFAHSTSLLTRAQQACDVV